MMNEMIKGIGIDIEDIKRFEISMNNYNFLKKIFTEKEISYCQSKANPAQHFAVRFAGKEAVIKAVSSHLKIILDYKEIEITNNGSGAPSVKVTHEGFGQEYNVLISLSHQGTMAIAMVLLKIDLSKDF